MPGTPSPVRSPPPRALSSAAQSANPCKSLCPTGPELSRHRHLLRRTRRLACTFLHAFVFFRRNRFCRPGANPLLGKFLGLTHSRHVVLKLSGLFALDSFAGGFVIQSFAAYWFYLRFGVQPRSLGAIFFWANVFAGISALLASTIAARIGLVRTMVFTHLPSNVLLILVPLMPNVSLAMLVLLLRFSISQMDVPTRQSYTMAVVAPEERSAAGGITGVARTAGAAISPLFAGLLFAKPALISVPFFLAGSLKILYDLLLYKEFASVRPPEETH